MSSAEKQPQNRIVEAGFAGRPTLSTKEDFGGGGCLGMSLMISSEAADMAAWALDRLAARQNGPKSEFLTGDALRGLGVLIMLNISHLVNFKLLEGDFPDEVEVIALIKDGQKIFIPDWTIFRKGVGRKEWTFFPEGKGKPEVRAFQRWLQADGQSGKEKEVPVMGTPGAKPSLFENQLDSLAGNLELWTREVLGLKGEDELTLKHVELLTDWAVSLVLALAKEEKNLWGWVKKILNSQYVPSRQIFFSFRTNLGREIERTKLSLSTLKKSGSLS